MFSKKDILRNECMLRGPLRRQGYDWWWHSLTARNARTGEEKPFFIEFFLCNPGLAGDRPTLGQLPENKAAGKKLLNSVFEIGGGRPKVFGVALDRKLLGGFYYEGKCYEFNFSKFWTLSRTAFEAEETDDEILWYVRQETFKAIMGTRIRCFKEDMLLINYEAPNGTGRIKLYKKSLFRKPKLIDDVTARNIGCEYGEYDTTEPYTKKRK